MFVLRLTSDPSLHGMETDDGFIIGEFTGDTAFLLLTGAASGIILALPYAAGRLWFPKRFRAPVSAAVFGIAGGSAIIHPGGIDFVLLEPLWLAIALFVVVPEAEGWLVALLVERFLSETSVFMRWRPWLVVPLPLLPLVATGPLGLIVLLFVGLLVVAVARADPDVGKKWTSPALSWIGRAAIAGLTVWSGVALVRDSVEILS